MRLRGKRDPCLKILWIVGLCYEQKGSDTWSLDSTFRSRRNAILNANYTSAFIKSLF